VYTPLVELGRAWSANLGDRVDRVDLIGSGNPPLGIFKKSLKYTKNRFYVKN